MFSVNPTFDRTIALQLCYFRQNVNGMNRPGYEKSKVRIVREPTPIRFVAVSISERYDADPSLEQKCGALNAAAQLAGGRN